MIRRFLLTWLANFVGLFLASVFFSGISADGILVIVIASFIFGLVNALIKPILVILSLPAIVLTFGLFSLIINALMLYITSAIYKPFQVNSIWSAIGTVVVVWIANYAMSFIIDDNWVWFARRHNNLLPLWFVEGLEWMSGSVIPDVRH